MNHIHQEYILGSSYTIPSYLLGQKGPFTRSLISIFITYRVYFFWIFDFEGPWACPKYSFKTFSTSGGLSTLSLINPNHWHHIQVVRSRRNAADAISLCQPLYPMKLYSKWKLSPVDLTHLPMCHDAMARVQIKERVIWWWLSHNFMVRSPKYKFYIQ